MNYIGTVVRELRELAGLSRKELCEGICTEKYAYLIERGERTPSAEVLRLMGIRLGRNLFEYIEYLDCADPMRVHALIARLNLFRNFNQLDDLRDTIREAEALPDFARRPWVYELELNRAHYFVMTERRYAEGAARVEAVLRDIPPQYASGLYVVEMYVLLYTCRMLLEDWDAAERAIGMGERFAGRGQGAFRDVDLMISLRIGRFARSLVAGRYAEVAERGARLFQYQTESGHYGWVHMTCFLLAFAHLNMGMDGEAVRWFKKGLHIVLFGRMGGLHIVARFSEFWQLLDEERVPRGLKDELLSMYELSRD